MNMKFGSQPTENEITCIILRSDLKFWIMRYDEWLALPWHKELDYDSFTAIEINEAFYSRIKNRQLEPTIQSLLKMYWREANGN